MTNDQIPMTNADVFGHWCLVIRLAVILCHRPVQMHVPAIDMDELAGRVAGPV